MLINNSKLVAKMTIYQTLITLPIADRYRRGYEVRVQVAIFLVINAAKIC